MGPTRAAELLVTTWMPSLSQRAWKAAAASQSLASMTTRMGTSASSMVAVKASRSGAEPSASSAWCQPSRSRLDRLLAAAVSSLPDSDGTRLMELVRPFVASGRCSSATTLALRPKRLSDCAACCLMLPRSSFATDVDLAITPTATVRFARKAACTARRARSVCLPSTMVVMLVSLQPWAMALMLTPAWPSAVITLPATPGQCDMPSPTTAMMVTSSTICTDSMWPAVSSGRKTSRTACWARGPSRARSATVMDCSDEAWAMAVTLMPRECSAEKKRELTPGMPTMPRPITLMRHMSFIADTPQISRHVVSGDTSKMRVPRSLGAKVFRMKMGMLLASGRQSRRACVGCIVLGCTTLAPKWASSAASL
mmetsp:Transcript_19724/g.58210  ORF Transcript_19724/g.58210 Transcript_19724/m.58210 type:complete len:368 (+) Transcript_19724:1194-2297(+)